MTRYSRPPSSPAACTGTRFGWSIAAARRASSATREASSAAPGGSARGRGLVSVVGGRGGMIAPAGRPDAMSDLDRAVEAIVGRCLGVREGEQVAVVVDGSTRALGDALRAAAAAAGADAVLTVMDERGEHGQEPPAPVAAALVAADVFVAPTAKSLSHTRARKAATDAGARGATLPGVTEDMLARLMACDFETLQRRSGELARLLDAAGEARITCPRGTDLRLDLSGRPGIADDGDLTGEAAFGNLPFV